MKKDHKLSLLIQNIRESGLEPPKLKISRLGELTFVAAYSEKPSSVMANNVASGVDFNPGIATLKALVEFYERQSFAYGVDHADPICQRVHSDGVASFPSTDPSAQLAARGNALHEAVERYVWAYWWDNSNIAHKLIPVEQSQFWGDFKFKESVRTFQKYVPLRGMHLVTPLHSRKEQNVLILFSELKNGGFISGGAAGPTNKNGETIVRALAELIRHGLGLKKFSETRAEPSTFYEERLLYFGLGRGNALVNARLSSRGIETIAVPALEVDNSIVAPPYQKIVYTHRCLFPNQPPFVDGDLERLCL